MRKKILTAVTVLAAVVMTSCAPMTQQEADAWAKAMNDVNRSAQQIGQQNQRKYCNTQYMGYGNYQTQCY